MTWRSLLSGEDRLRTREVALRIGRHVAGRLETATLDASLFDGRAGLAVTFAYLGRVFPEESFADLAVAEIEHAIESTGGELMPGLAAGMVGVAWAANHVAAQLPDRFDAALIDDDFDRGLAEVVEAWPEGAYDLMTGIAGIGLYAATRSAHPGARVLCDAVVRRLGAIVDGEFYQTCEQLPPLQRPEFPDGIRDLGLAHGAPGVIACLARIVRGVPASPDARTLLARAVHWLLAQERAHDEGSMFPRWITPSGGAVSAPLGWCYGDPGVACALRIAGEVLDDPRGKMAARKAVQRVAVRSPETPNPGICHGAAGIGHILNRFAHELGDASLTKAARAWLLHAAALPFWEEHPQVLGGSAGHALALAAASSDEAPVWDDCLAIW